MAMEVTREMGWSRYVLVWDKDGEEEQKDLDADYAEWHLVEDGVGLDVPVFEFHRIPPPFSPNHPPFPTPSQTHRARFQTHSPRSQHSPH